MLKRPQARHGIKAAKTLAADVPRILEVDLEAVLAAGRQLGRGQGDPHPRAAASPSVCQQWTPATAEVQQPASRPDPDLGRHIVMLAPLRLLEAEREVPIEFGAAEIRQLTQAEPDDPVGEGIGEVDVAAIRHLIP